MMDGLELCRSNGAGEEEAMVLMVLVKSTGEAMLVQEKSADAMVQRGFENVSWK